jgi:hypothetical protein
MKSISMGKAYHKKRREERGVGRGEERREEKTIKEKRREEASFEI